eukprot:1137360-Pelagomonas_calceolata.AAC.2
MSYSSAATAAGKVVLHAHAPEVVMDHVIQLGSHLDSRGPSSHDDERQQALTLLQCPHAGAGYLLFFLTRTRCCAAGGVAEATKGDAASLRAMWPKGQC